VNAHDLLLGHPINNEYGVQGGVDNTHYFKQFIDAVFQLMHQFPTSLEFNENFLIAMLDSIYSMRFGTFFFNTPKARLQHQIQYRSASFWYFVNSNRTLFVNPFYDPKWKKTSNNSNDSSGKVDLLCPSTTMDCMLLWKKFYYRWTQNNNKPVGSGITYEQLAHQYYSALLHVQQAIRAFGSSLLSPPPIVVNNVLWAPTENSAALLNQYLNSQGVSSAQTTTTTK
jgi:hypothetical protein